MAQDGPMFQKDLFLAGYIAMKLETQTSHESKSLDFFSCTCFSQQQAETEIEFLAAVKLYAYEGAGIRMSTVKLNTPFASCADL